MKSQDVQIPPYCHYEFRCTDSFHVLSNGILIGPDDATKRRFAVETAEELLELTFEYPDKAKVSSLCTVRPCRYEENNGIPVEVSRPIHEPTIQEMLRMYIAEAREVQTEEPETPDEFFDFDMDDEQDVLTSPYEFDEMMDEYPEDRRESTGAEGADDTEPREVAEQEPPEQEPEKAANQR